MSQTVSSSLLRARRRVLRAARDLAREACVERHNETFYATLARAVELLVLSVDGDYRVLSTLWREARQEREGSDEG